MRSACRDELVYKEYEGKRYCVLHYPGDGKDAEFELAHQRKLQASDFDYRGVFFPAETDFSGKNLTIANFTGATFKSRANFRSAQFGEAHFFGTRFGDADFSLAKFGDADFGNAIFKEATFLGSQFDKVYFSNTEFNGDAKFNPATFLGRASFSKARFDKRAFFGTAQFLGGSYFGNAIFRGLADFGEVAFGGPHFESAQFATRANFEQATFSGSPVFVGAQFHETDFRRTEFKGTADFRESNFNGYADFSAAVLNTNVLFDDVEFERNVYFNDTNFLGSLANKAARNPTEDNADDGKRIVSFDDAKFKEGVVFDGSRFDPQITVRFSGATFAQPDLVRFQRVTLRPMWFAGVNVRRLHFIRARWSRLRSWKFISREIQSLTGEALSARYESLELVCRQLAANAEENNRYEEAARFRFLANSARGRGSWSNLIVKPSEPESWGNLNLLLWIYGLVSGYGERAWQAALVLVGICVLFAAIYYRGQQTGEWWRSSTPGTSQKLHERELPLLRDFGEALIYSAGVLTLQKPEPVPANKRAKAFVLLETVLGPLQLALLALAIRRKFMR
jgi:uncharacterized protein YjbI with pentapeptide repeats